MRHSLNEVLHYLHGLGSGAESEGLTDRQLLERFASLGDEVAFAVVMRRHAALVLGVCWRALRHQQDVEDAFQATFLVLARKAGVVGWDDSVAGWVYQVACRVSAEARGKVSRRRSHEQQGGELPEPVSPTLPGEGEDAALVDRELQRLPEKYRLPLLLCCLEGHSRHEAATRLGWTEGMVKGRLERGRELLRRRLARLGLTVEGTAASVTVPATLVRDTLALVGPTAPAPVETLAAPVAELARAAMSGFAAERTRVAVVLGVLLATGVLAGGLLARPKPASVAAAPAVRPPSPAPKKDADRKQALTLRHEQAVRGVALSRDGRRLASASFDGTFRLWDTTTGKVLHRWEAPSLNSALALAPDGRTLAGGNSTGELFVWDMENGKETAARLVRRGNIYYLAFSPDGRWLASANHEGTVGLHEGTNGRVVRLFTGHLGRVWSVAFSPDGRTLASGGEDGAICLWSIPDGRLIRRIGGGAGWVSVVAFHPREGVLVSASWEGEVAWWDPGTGRKLRQQDSERIHSLAFRPDGKQLALGAMSGKVYLWDGSSGRPLRSLPPLRERVFGIAWSADGRWLSAAGDQGTIEVWRVP